MGVGVGVVSVPLSARLQKVCLAGKKMVMDEKVMSEHTYTEREYRAADPILGSDYVDRRKS